MTFAMPRESTMTSYAGQQFIGGVRRASGQATLHSFDARTGQALPGAFHQATEAEVDAAAQAAAAAYPIYRALPAARRAEFLDAIAEALDALGDDFIDTVCRERPCCLGASSANGHVPVAN